MKYAKTTLSTILVGLLFAWTTAMAAPAIDTLNVQGYMKKANGSAVTNGTYTLAIGVFQNGTAIWGKSYSVTVASGLFAQSLSGLGADLSALPAGTGMNSNFSAATLDPALLQASGAGVVKFRIYAVSTIDGANPQFDVTLASVPTAYVASIAQSVKSGGVTLTAMASSSMAATSAGAADAGKLVALNGSGLIDTSMLPSLPASQIGSGQVGVSNGGTGLSGGTSGGVLYFSGASTFASSGALSANSIVIGGGAGAAPSTPIAAGSVGNVLMSAGAGSDPSFGALNLAGGATYVTGSLPVGNGGTGGTDAATARSGIGAAAAGANSDITSLTGLTTALSVAQGGTGGTDAATARSGIGAAASGANTDITSLSFGGASTLSAYSENQSCSMTIAGTTVAGTGTYTANVCYYTKIGKLVELNWYVVTSAHNGTGNLSFTGLPFASLNVANFNQSCRIEHSGVTFAAGTGLKGIIAPNTTTVTVKNIPATNVADAAVAMDTTVTLYVHCAYLAN